MIWRIQRGLAWVPRIRVLGYAVLGLFVIASLCLSSCRPGPFRPSSAARVDDRWLVEVARDGVVSITRSVALDTQLAVYLRNSAALDSVKLFGELDRQTSNACGPIFNQDDVIALECSTEYHISAMPTVPQATLTFPEDLLFDFLLNGLAYQPLALRVTQDLDVVVPGKVSVSDQKQAMRFPVYASRLARMSSTGPSKLRLTSEVILAPGDLVHPDMRHLDPIEFKPLVGMPE